MLINIILLFIIMYIGYQYMTKQLDCHKTDTIKTLMRQSARWTMASNKDANPIIALQHANYGSAYLWALRDIASDKEIEEATGVNVSKFKDEIIKEQNAITKHVMNLCPKTGPKKIQLSKQAGEF